MQPRQQDTIVAVATPPGKGALAVVRLSGPRARELTRRVLAEDSDPPPRRPVLRKYLDAQGRFLDRVLITFFSGPASYTGEDVAEISCHGSPAVTREILDTLLAAGARLAEPGEFTLRAFFNGKMDLAQAEAVRDLIESQTRFQARLAAGQLEGRLSLALQPLKQEVVRVVSHLETALEFVEDEVEPETRRQLVTTLRAVDAQLEQMETGFRLGKLAKEGLTATIVGRPNAGKSSVFNRLVQAERAIVTALPGTTRDALTEWISLEGIPFQLVDTAGIRETADPIEDLGVRKSREYIGEADLILFVVDRSRAFGPEDRQIWEWIRARECLLVLNKADLPPVSQVPSEIEAAVRGSVTISALHAPHLNELQSAIRRAVLPEQGWEEERVLVTNRRHQACLHESREELRRGIEALAGGLSEEFPLYNLRKSLEALGRITGATTVEDILNEIFSTFCIGK